MSVVYSIGSTFAGGGIGTTAYHAVRGIQRHGLLTRLLCDWYRPSTINPKYIRALGILGRVLRRSAIHDPSGWSWLLQAILYDTWAASNIEEAELFHVWGNYGRKSLRRARALGMVTITERASSHPLYQARLLQDEYKHWNIPFPTLKATIRRSCLELEEADFVLVPSDFVSESFTTHHFSKRRLIQIPFGVDVTRFYPVKRAENRPFRALFVGQIGLRKGIPYLLEAWRRLGWHDAELWLVGQIEPSLLALFARWQKLPGLHVKGYIADPTALFQQADVFVFPTIEEGSALVTYEALASGLPLITTSNAGSVARDGVEGWIVPIRNSDALASKLALLRSNITLRKHMSEAARARAELFTWDHYGDQIVEAYRRLGVAI